MPRRPRVHQPGGFYHVTLRGNHQRDIFFAAGDRILLSSIVARTIEKYDARVHAYCWMSNHIHLLMQAGNEPLAESMRQIAGEYARAMLAKLQVTGHLFERRYHARMVDVDAYLLELVRYIHLNPVTAGIVADAAHYRWSSHHNYVGRRADAWVTTSFALNMFGSTREKGVAAYLKFLSSTDGAAWEPPADDDSCESNERPAPQVSQLAPALRSRQTLQELITEACRRFDVDSAQLNARVRDAYLAKVRGWIAAQARQRRIASLAEVARALERDEGTLRYAMRTYPDEMD